MCVCVYIYEDMNKIYQNAETFFLHGEITDDICFPLNVFFSYSFQMSYSEPLLIFIIVIIKVTVRT